MAFCTTCGATVQGAFCQQCGARVSTASGQSATSQPGGPSAAPLNPTAPVKRKTSPLVWILVGILGIFLLCVIGVIAAGVFVAKNPGMVMSKIITAGNPNVEVLSTDLGSRTLRIRDRRTGKEVTVSFDDVKNGRFKFSATGDDGQVASVEMGEGIGKLPSWVPTYPGARAQGNFTAKGESADGIGEGGLVSFHSADAPSKVISFYEEKCKDMGMSVELTQVTSDGGMVVAKDDSGRALHVMVGSDSGETTIAITFGRKR
jgi:hypothetical protein